MKRPLTWGLGFVLLLALFVFPTVAAHASKTVKWTGGGDGHDWTKDENWDTGSAPEDDDIVDIPQAPGGPSNIVNVPALHLKSLTLGPGSVSLDSTAQLTADAFEWKTGTIYLSLQVNQVMFVEGSDRHELNDSLIGPGQITLSGDGFFTGAGGMFNSGGSKFFNDGDIQGGDFSGGFLWSGGQIINSGTIKGSPVNPMTLENVDLDNKNVATLGPGHVQVLSSTVHLRADTHLAGDVEFNQRTEVIANGGVTVRNGATPTLLPSATIDGIAPEFRVSGPNLSATFHWAGGQMNQGPVFHKGVDLEISGPLLKTLDSGGKKPLHIDSGVQVTQRGTGALRLLGTSEIINLGKWVVPDGQSPRVEGGACCAHPPVFSNQGTVQIAPDRALTVANLRFHNTDDIVGVANKHAGNLLFEGGDNFLAGGTNIDNVNVGFLGRGAFKLQGTVTLANKARMLQADQTEMSGVVTLTGDGKYQWTGGTIYGRPTFADGVTLDIEPTDPHTMNATFHGGVIVAEGKSTLAADVTVASVGADSAGIENDGTMSWVGGTLTGFGSQGFFKNQDTLTVNPGNGNDVTLTGFDMRNMDTLTLKSGTLHVAEDLVQTAGLTKLAGGDLEVDGLLRLQGGELRGPGAVHGVIQNTGGTVDTAAGAVGELDVLGSYTQGSGGHLKLKVKSTQADGFDRLVATGLVSLAGTLGLSRLGSTALSGATLPIVAGSSRTGTFGSVSGLASLGSGWHVAYTRAKVNLHK